MTETVKFGGIDGLDLRSVTLNTMSKNGIFTTQRKKDAAAFARTHGWFVKDVSLAYNRFMKFWIVCQQQADEMAILRKDGSVARLPLEVK